MVSTCKRCGDLFKSRFPNAKLCFNCWRKREEAFAQWDGLNAYARRLERKLMETTAPTIPAGLLSKMIRLCHPDRHNNSASSNEVTRWLLEQRRFYD